MRQPEGGLSAIHLMGTVVNAGGSTGVLMRLEAELTDPAKSAHRFVWNEFYRYREGGREFEKVTDPQPVAVKPGEAVTLLVQLRPADGKPCAEWPPGESLVSVVGWVNGSGRVDKPAVSRSFHVRVDASTASALRETDSRHVVFRVPVVEWQPLEIRAAAKRHAG